VQRLLRDPVHRRASRRDHAVNVATTVLLARDTATTESEKWEPK
jgi:hypothetical protein